MLINRASSPGGIEDFSVVGLVELGIEIERRLLQQLVDGIAKMVHRTMVCVREAQSHWIEDEDGIIRSIKGRPELIQLPLRLLAQRDVANDPGKHLPGTDQHLADGKLGGKFSAILAAPGDLPADADHLSRAGRGIICQVAIMLLPVG